MNFDSKLLARVFSSQIMVKAIQAFDKGAMAIVAICWAVALLTMVFALYTINLTSATKRGVAMAEAQEPSVPRIATQTVQLDELRAMSDKLTKKFPDISFGASGELLVISAADGSKFRQWLSILSYVDTISYQYRWSIKELCIGTRCPGKVPMRASLAAEKISFTPPDAQKP